MCMPFKAEISQNTALSRLPALLRRAGQSPSIETVHKLRTTIRRAETVLKSDSRVADKKLLKQLKHIRKRAGRVRDIDVQLEILKSFGGRNHAEVISVRRVLIRKREKQERKLSKAVLRAFQENLQAVRLLTAKDDTRQVTANVNLQELAASFLAERRSQALSPDNLHNFRIACKHLRYRAELATASAARDQLIKQLRRVQDAIGLWHDCVTLIESAKKVLGSEQSTSLQRHLHVQTHARYLDALRIVKEVERALEVGFASPPRKPSRSESAIVTRSASVS